MIVRIYVNYDKIRVATHGQIPLETESENTIKGTALQNIFTMALTLVGPCCVAPCWNVIP